MLADKRDTRAQHRAPGTASPEGVSLCRSHACLSRSRETPFNENLVLSSEGCNNPVIAGLMASTITPCVGNVPLSPGWRNEFHVGLGQAFGKYLVFDGGYIWKYTHKAYAFSVLGDSPITFPIEWDRSKIPGYAFRISVPNWHGLTAFAVMSHVAARFFEPQVSGIGEAPTGSEAFRIDHDENFNETTHLQYQPWKKGPWFGFNWRYDSGQVAGPVPCIGGNCANGPNGTDTEVDVSGLTPDQQFQAGLYGGSGACQSDHTHQSQRVVPGIFVRLEPGKNPGAWH
jgi:hypothetical protein